MKRIYLLGLILIILLLAFSSFFLTPTSNPTFGISFEPNYAKYLGLDPKQLYLNILTDLKPKKIRLNAYWDRIEPADNKFNFEDMDFYINEATKSGAEVVLAVGYKLPRWPECRSPKWLDPIERSEKQLRMVQNAISYYDHFPGISMFQIENEPLLGFGVCPKPNKELLLKEVQLVRSLTQKPLLVTDSGELGFWISAMQNSDVFGTTIYRKVFDPIIGYVTYPIPPNFYSLKSNIIRSIFAKNNQKTIIAELQGEIWTNKTIPNIPADEQAKSYSLKDLQNSVNYSRKTGFDEVYLWGVEWWYFMAQKNHPEYLEYVKELF